MNIPQVIRRFFAGLFLLLFAASAQAYTAADFEYRTHTASGSSMPYRLFVPRNPEAGRKYPLVLFLHGLGEQGTDNETQLGNEANGALAFVSNTNQATNPCYMLAPQSWNGWWGSYVGLIGGALDALQTEFPNIDTDRIYITGLSAGGQGTMLVITRYPARFAAALPLSMADTADTDKALYPGLVGLPIWFACAKNDSLFSASENNVLLLRKLGSTALFTEYNGGGHSKTVWAGTWNDARIFSWLFAQKRGVAPPPDPVTVQITTPTAGHGYDSGSATLALAGNATAPSGVTLANVQWFNARIGAPTVSTATGTTNWTVSSAGLLSGLNTLTVIARVNHWNTGSLAGITSSNDILTVSYNVANQAPLADAGPDQRVLASQAASLNGSVEDDALPASGTLTATWSKLVGPGTVTFGNATSPATTAQFSAPGVYVLRLTASDSAVASMDDVTITSLSPGSLSGRWLIDFGDTTNVTSGNWNNVAATAANTLISNLKDTFGNATSIALRITSSFTGVNSSGTTVSPLYPASATRDSFYVQNTTVGRVTLEGLKPAARYDLTFFASRLGADDRVTDYTVGPATVTFDPTDNVSNTPKILAAAPDASGRIVIEIRANGAAGYGYLGVLDVVEKTTDTYSAWTEREFAGQAGDPQISAPTADPESDGVSNLVEYALGTDPLAANGQGGPSTAVQGDRLRLTFTRQANPDVTYIVEASSNLVSWTAIATYPALGSGWTGPAVVSETGTAPLITSAVQDVVSAAAQTSRFLRLRIRNY